MGEGEQPEEKHRFPVSLFHAEMVSQFCAFIQDKYEYCEGKYGMGLAVFVVDSVVNCADDPELHPKSFANIRNFPK